MECNVIHNAIEKDNLEVFCELIRHQVNVHVRNDDLKGFFADFRTTLHKATCPNRPDYVLYLLKMRVDSSLRDKYNQTALECARKLDYRLKKEIVKYLSMSGE